MFDMDLMTMLQTETSWSGIRLQISVGAQN